MSCALGLSLRSTASLSVCRMETFPAVAEEVLREFQVLLQHSPPPIGSTRMLQLVAINMFAVYNSQPKGTTCCVKGTALGIESLCAAEVLMEKGGGLTNWRWMAKRSGGWMPGGVGVFRDSKGTLAGPQWRSQVSEE